MPAKHNRPPKSAPAKFSDDAAPVNGAMVEDVRGAPVPEAAALPAGAVPDAAGPVGFTLGIGNGGATVGLTDGAAVAGALETSTEAVVSVGWAGGGALVWLLSKLAGSLMPLSVAQVAGSTPSGQQRPWTRQKEPDGQGSEGGC